MRHGRKKLSVTFYADDRSYKVRGTYLPPFRGSFYGKNGDPGDPPEAEEWEVESITDEATGLPVLTDAWPFDPEDDEVCELFREAYSEAVEREMGGKEE